MVRELSWLILLLFFRGVEGIHDAQTIFIEAYRLDRGENGIPSQK